MKKIVFSILSIMILISTGCSKKNSESFIPVPPKVISQSGTEYTLPCNDIVKVSADELNSEYSSVFCKKIGRDFNDETLNSVWFGENIYGVGLASIVYFNKYASELNKNEWKALSEIALYPEKYGNPSDMQQIQNDSLFSEVSFSIYSEYSSRIQNSTYFDAMTEQIVTDMVAQKNYTRQQAFEILYNRGVTIESCLSDEIQKTVDSVYSDKLSFTDENQKVFPQSACVIMDYSGNVLAMAGGNNGNNAYNRAYRTYNSIGSTVKPIAVYTSAIVNNIITFSSLVDDEPVNISGSPWPSNYDDRYEGEITATYALRQSKNTVPVRLLDTIGIENSFNFLKNELHFSSLNDDDCNISSMAMGYFTKGISLTELASSYQMFGNGGNYCNPKFYKRVLDSDGEVIIEKENISEKIINSDDAWIMNRMLFYNVEMPDGLAFNAKLDNGCEVIGKTGTVDNEFGADTDKLFVGGTPEYLSAVWVGFDSKGSSINDMKYKSPCLIWKNIMEKISEKNQKFESDKSISEIKYCKKTGQRASEKCPETETGYYKPDTVPQKCSVH